jgi:hypothetical protein
MKRKISSNNNEKKKKITNQGILFDIIEKDKITEKIKEDKNLTKKFENKEIKEKYKQSIVESFDEEFFHEDDESNIESYDFEYFEKDIPIINEFTDEYTLEELEKDFYGLPIEFKSLFKEFRNINTLYDWQKEILNMEEVKNNQNCVYSLPTRYSNFKIKRRKNISVS